jgi:plastocyanin
MPILPSQLGLVILLAALSPAGPAKVTVKTFAFGPKALEVATGTTVTWANADDIEHTITSGAPDRPDGAFDHSLAGKGATATVRFDAPGTWSYFCKRHSFMRGEVRVVSKGER